MPNPPLRSVARIFTFALLIGLLGWLVFRPRPNLDGLDRLLAAGQYKAAEIQLLDYLRALPADGSARILLARVSVDRPDPKPEFALEQIADFQPVAARQAAQVEAIRGDAFFLQQRYDRAESAWLEALRLEPKTAEVGWGLLNLYALQGRIEESNRLALRLFEAEPDAHDRVQLLLQMIRLDAHSMEVGAIVHQLEPIVRAYPEDLASTLALGTAMVQSGRGAEGLDLLHKAVKSRPTEPQPWIHLASALCEAGQAEELAQVLAEVPPAARELPRTFAARGWLAMQRQEWAEAAEAYLKAFLGRPGDASSAYRLKMALLQAHRDEDLARLAPRIQAALDSKDKFRQLYDRIDAAPDLGLGSLPQAYHELATLLREVGRTEEATLWDRVALPGASAIP